MSVDRIRGWVQSVSWYTMWVWFSLCVFLVLGVSNNIRNPQISYQASIIYEETVRQDRLVINFDLPSEPSTLVSYIEDCRMKLWDYAFPSFFRGQDAFNKTHDFDGYKGTELIVRRVLFR